MNRRRHGFTLVELIVVMAIVAILTAIAFPVTSHVVQAGKTTGCISNLSKLGVALQLYLGEHNEIMPNLQPGRASTSQQVAVIDNTLNAYATDPRVFACPADNQGIAAATGTSYYWNMLLDGQSVANLQFLLSNAQIGPIPISGSNGPISLNGHTSEIPVLCDKQGFHPYTANKVNLLYADGHASQDLIFTTSQ